MRIARLNANAFARFLEQPNTLILDSRPSTLFTQAFIPDSISIGLDGNFAEWVGTLISRETRLLLVAQADEEAKTLQLLQQEGYTRIEGILDGGIAAWRAAGMPIDMIIDVSADELLLDLPYDQSLTVVDVRKDAEYAEGHLEGAMHLPLSNMTDAAQIAMLPEKGNLYVHCVRGYRSVIACSLLKRQGIHHLRNVMGGWDAISRLEGVKAVKEPRLLN